MISSGLSRLTRLLVAVAAFALLVPGAAQAQSRTEAQLQLQIQQLQEQIRLLTGQVEGLQYNLTQLQTMIETMSGDIEFRFQQLEGGAPAAAPGNTSAITIDPAPLPEVTSDPAMTAALPEAPLTDPAPLDLGLGESADPLVGSNNAGTGTLGTLGGEDLTLGGNRPLQLDLNPSASISNGDAQAQYKAGYDAVVRGDYAFAEDQFSQFIQLYPDDPNAADATNWLGEALMQRGAYDEAAVVLAEGYSKYQQTDRAPDLMLRLGIALVGAGLAEDACRTFFTLSRRYTNLSPAFQQRLADEKSRAQCPV